MNVNKMLKSVNVEQVIVCILVVILVVLVVYYVNKNNEGFDDNGDNDKPTLYFFYVDWCGYCKKANQSTFNDEKWNTIENRNEVNLVKVNCEGTEEEKQLAKEYEVSAYPHIVLKNNNKSKELNAGVSPSSISNLISTF